MSAKERTISFWDPHFHVWDSVNGPHDPKALGGPCDASRGGLPIYTLAQYEEHISEAADLGIKGIGGVIVEALPLSDEPMEECQWLVEQVSQHRAKYPQRSEGRSYELIGRIVLKRPDTAKSLVECNNFAEETKAKSLSGRDLRICGLREIINFEPTWPRIGENALENNNWIHSFETHIAKAMDATGPASANAGLRVFELHCNPHQLPLAVDALVSKYPHINFVLDHLGCLKIKADDSAEVQEAAYQEWEDAIAKFASFPNAFIKISGASYVQPYEERPARDASGNDLSYPTRCVAAALQLFGAKRLMVASNYPVSHWEGCTPKRFFTWLLRDTVIGSALTTEEQDDVFAQNAIRVYTGGCFSPLHPPHASKMSFAAVLS